MDYQTWTRRTNAEAAVKKALANVGMEFYIVSVKAHNVSVSGSEYAVVVEIDNPPSDADALQEILGNKARVRALMAEPVPAEAQHNSDDGESAPQHEEETKKTARRKTRRLFPTEGNNPFRPGSASYDAYAAIEAAPGTTFAEAKAMGLRMRAISHALKMGWIEEKE